MSPDHGYMKGKRGRREGRGMQMNATNAIDPKKLNLFKQLIAEIMRKMNTILQIFLMKMTIKTVHILNMQF